MTTDAQYIATECPNIAVTLEPACHAEIGDTVMVVLHGSKGPRGLKGIKITDVIRHDYGVVIIAGSKRRDYDSYDMVIRKS